MSPVKNTRMTSYAVGLLALLQLASAQWNFTCAPNKNAPSSAVCNTRGTLGPPNFPGVQLLPFAASSMAECGSISYAIQNVQVVGFGYDTATRLCHPNPGPFTAAKNGTVIYSDSGCQTCTSGNDVSCAASTGRNLLYNADFSWTNSSETMGPWLPAVNGRENTSAFSIQHSKKGVSLFTTVPYFSIYQDVLSGCGPEWQLFSFDYNLNHSSYYPAWAIGPASGNTYVQYDVQPNTAPPGWVHFEGYIQSDPNLNSFSFQTFIPEYPSVPPQPLRLANMYLGRAPAFTVAPNATELVAKKDRKGTSYQGYLQRDANVTLEVGHHYLLDVEFSFTGNSSWYFYPSVDAANESPLQTGVNTVVTPGMTRYQMPLVAYTADSEVVVTTFVQKKCGLCRDNVFKIKSLSLKEMTV